ncbi:predicted protein [Postia placenta Mad-698-R]|nr:predicted protein [Postia placenta Mad-698-R]
MAGPDAAQFLVVQLLSIFSRTWASSRMATCRCESTNDTSLYMIVTSLAILSALPHQEPRFLVPLVVPSIVLVVLDGRIQRAGNLFWVSWIITNLALVLLFGILHQGGVVPSLFHLHDVIGKLWASSQGDKIVKVFYWKTYMPPRHLLAIPESDVLSGKFTITDLSGAGAIVEQLMAVPSTATSFLVAPLHATRALTKKYPGCVMLKERVYPHLSLDHISETVEVGWKDGLSLGIYVVDAVCFRLHKTLSS